MQSAKVGVRCRALPLQHIPVGPRIIAVGGSSGPRRGSGSSKGTEPLSHARWGKEGVMRCGKTGEDKIWTPLGPPRDNPCLSFPAKPACDVLPRSRHLALLCLSRQNRRCRAPSILGADSRRGPRPCFGAGLSSAAESANN